MILLQIVGLDKLSNNETHRRAVLNQTLNEMRPFSVLALEDVRFVSFKFRDFK